ncbi:hypothetical protein TNIN_87941 [Trichonephila inaurata madagascariensis]|uniref:Uncharacterized protein n=1 Tax=Trichonephila inaurata madagascariensis TaxID=2747483 RepID=A0A8X7CQ25_9ARAC|nr:hypothetical protein TNIN_87941 [Trichonephila inaurata madagascariensis]
MINIYRLLVWKNLVNGAIARYSSFTGGFNYSNGDTKSLTDIRGTQFFRFCTQHGSPMSSSDSHEDLQRAPGPMPQFHSHSSQCIISESAAAESWVHSTTSLKRRL